MSDLTDYEYFVPPRPPDFDNWSTREAREYFEWFVAQIPSRLEHLRAVVRRHEGCELDLEPDSLSCLGEFFVEHVTTQLRTGAEIERQREKIPEQLRDVIRIDDWELTYETLSLCFDVGIYFAETLRRAHPELEWVLWKRRTIEYHRPVLDFSGGALDAPRIMNNVALKAAEGTSKPNELRDLFDVWEGIAIEVREAGGSGGETRGD